MRCLVLRSWTLAPPTLSFPQGKTLAEARHPRFKVHFVPTSSSWLNMVERWFAELTGKAVRRGSFSSVPDLIAAIQEFIEEWNRDPKPFIWTARAEDILEKIERCRRRLEEIKPGCTVRRGRKKAA